MSSTPTTTYRGSCHCQSHVFTVSLPELKDNGLCDCSHCAKRAIIWGFAPPGTEVIWEKGGDGEMLTRYRFGEKSFDHTFCTKCGTLIPVSKHDPEKQTAFNVRSLRNIGDVWALPLTQYHGIDRPPTYIPPTTPPHSLIPSSGETLHTGGCHCKAVEFVVACKPLEEMEVVDCNCSICQGNGCLWIYPNFSRTTFSPSSANALTEYTFGPGDNIHYFCRTCGVNVYERSGGRERYGLNVRLINGVDVGKLKVKQEDGRKDLPEYVLP